MNKNRLIVRLLEHIPDVADLQCAWLLLLYSANARSTYLLRLVPPDLAEPFAEAHGTAILTCMANLITGDATPLPPPAAAQARLPTRLGGLGLRSAAEQRHAAYSASWSDALPAIQLRTGTSRSRALVGITAAAKHTSAKGAHPRNRAPTSHRLWPAANGKTSWQAFIRNTLPLNQATPSADGSGMPAGWRARGRDALYNPYPRISGPAALLGRLLRRSSIYSAPPSPELELPNQHFRVALLRRLGMPLPIAPRRCGCGNDLDQYGDHRAACATTGALAARAPALETAVAKICREAGGRVARNVAVANMNIASPITDGRRIEIVANGLQVYHGQQLAIDTTCVSPISRAGFSHPGTTSEPGRAVATAVARKRRRYPELLAARSRCRLLVCWGVEARNRVRHLATQRSQDAPSWLRAAACAGWIARWTGIVAVATQRVLASSLLELPPHGDTIDGDIPSLPDPYVHAVATHEHGFARLLRFCDWLFRVASEKKIKQWGRKPAKNIWNDDVFQKSSKNNQATFRQRGNLCFKG